jgi:hypothetical protein
MQVKSIEKLHALADKIAEQNFVGKCYIKIFLKSQENWTPLSKFVSLVP